MVPRLYAIILSAGGVQFATIIVLAMRGPGDRVARRRERDRGEALIVHEGGRVEGVKVVDVKRELVSYPVRVVRDDEGSGSELDIRRP